MISPLMLHRVRLDPRRRFLPQFSIGYTIQVSGAANAPNNGVFFIQSIPNPGFAIQVFGMLQDEAAQNGGNNPQAKIITISSIGERISPSLIPDLILISQVRFLMTAPLQSQILRLQTSSM